MRCEKIHADSRKRGGDPVAGRRWMKIMEIGEATGCHQMPGRSFFFRGYQFPVCARCTGVFLGKFIADIMLIFKKVLSPVTALVMLLVMGADWFAQEAGILESTNPRRFVTGILGGAGVAFLYANAIIAAVMKIFGKKVIDDKSFKA